MGLLEQMRVSKFEKLMGNFTRYSSDTAASVRKLWHMASLGDGSDLTSEKEWEFASSVTADLSGMTPCLTKSGSVLLRVFLQLDIFIGLSGSFQSVIIWTASDQLINFLIQLAHLC